MKRILIALVLASGLPLWGAIQYAGGTNVNATFATTGVRQDLCNAIQDNLTTAGWTVDSGSHTSTIVMHTASTPTANNNVFMRLVDPGANASCQINIQNAAAAAGLTSQNFWLNSAAGLTYRMIANKYQAFIFQPGSANAQRGFLGVGTLYVPTFAQASQTGVLGWMMGQGSSVTDTATNWFQFRTNLAPGQCQGGNNSRMSVIAANTLLDYSCGNQNLTGAMQIPTVVTANISSSTNLVTTATQWVDTSYLLSDPLIAFSTSATTNPALVRGQLWDATVMSAGVLSIDQTATFNSHNWWTVTNTNAGAANTITAGQLLVVVP